MVNHNEGSASNLKRIEDIEEKIANKSDQQLIKNIQALISIECENKQLIKTLIEKIDIFAVNNTELFSDLQKFKEKIQTRDNLYESLLQSNLIEFDDHRKGISKLYEAHGIPCDDIVGWNINNEKEITKTKVKRFGFFRKRRRITRKNKS